MAIQKVCNKKAYENLNLLLKIFGNDSLYKDFFQKKINEFTQLEMQTRNIFSASFYGEYFSDNKKIYIPQNSEEEYIKNIGNFLIRGKTESFLQSEKEQRKLNLVSIDRYKIQKIFDALSLDDCKQEKLMNYIHVINDSTKIYSRVGDIEYRYKEIESQPEYQMFIENIIYEMNAIFYNPKREISEVDLQEFESLANSISKNFLINKYFKFNISAIEKVLSKAKVKYGKVCIRNPQKSIDFFEKKSEIFLNTLTNIHCEIDEGLAGEVIDSIYLLKFGKNIHKQVQEFDFISSQL